MAHVGELQPLLNKAKREGWHDWIRSAADEEAVLRGCYFDIKKAQRFEIFCRDFIKLQKGEYADRPFEFMDWQRDELFYPLFGWTNERGFRRYTRGYVELAKKNTKSTSLSAIALYMLCADGEPAAECYCAANDRDQAKLVWSPAADMVESSPELSEILNVQRSVNTIWLDSKSFLKAWSADASSKDGPDVHFLSCDELHGWKGQGRELWRKIKYAGIARRQPLCPFTITTAGNDRHSLCWEQHAHAERIIEGKTFDHSTFALMYRPNPQRLAEDPAYWKTEQCWKEANPCFGITLHKIGFEQAISEISSNPAEESTFKQFRCNIWVGSSEKWIPFEVWDQCNAPVNEDDLAGQDCYSGLDLATVEDLAALIHVFPGADGFYDLVCRFWCPQETILERTRRHNVPYELWANEGLIIPTEGATIDHEYILEQIKKDAAKFNIKEMPFDRHGAEWIKNRLIEMELELLEHGQGMLSMSAPAKHFYKCLKDKKIRHGGHKVLSWMADNVVIVKDSAGNIKPCKASSTEKIDGIVGAVMGLGRAWLQDPGSDYAKGGTRDIFNGNSK